MCGTSSASPDGLAPALREPPNGVSLRGSGNLRLPKACAFGHALFPFAAPAALRSACARAGSRRFPVAYPQIHGLSPRRLRKPAGPRYAPALVLLRGPRNPPVSSGIFFVIPAKAGIQGIRFAFLCHSRNAVSPSMFAVGERKPEILNQLFGVRYSSAIYRAPNAPGMGAVMRRSGCRVFCACEQAPRHRGDIAASYTKTGSHKPHLSGQPGPDIAQAMYGRRPNKLSC